MKRHILAACAAAALFAPAAHAQYTDNAIKIGLLSNFTAGGSEITGENSLIAVRMAIEDPGGKIGSTPIELVYADHQGKADIGATIVRKWFDVDGVDVVVEAPFSPITLAVHEIVREKNKVFLASGGASTRLTGDLCSPNTVHWFPDSYSFVKATGEAIVKEYGAVPWFILTRDDAFGSDVEKQIRDFLEANGTKPAGVVKHPLNNADLSSFILQAQASKAKIIAVANGSQDFVNTLKQAAEFNVLKDQKVVALSTFIEDIHGVGPKLTQGVLVANDFYWDLNDDTRKFSKRLMEKNGGKKPPSVNNAEAYSEVTHYLKAVKALGRDTDGKAVVAKMKELPTDDLAKGKGSIREDGRVLFPVYLFQVKSPAESKNEWDLFKLVSTVPGDKAFRPLSQSDCPMIKKWVPAPLVRAGWEGRPRVIRPPGTFRADPRRSKWVEKLGVA